MNIASILPTLLTAFAVALVFGWLNKKASEYNPLGRSSKTGSIRPHKSVMCFSLIVGVIIFGCGFIASLYFFDQMSVYGPVLTFMGACFILLSIPGLTSIHDVHWTDEYVDGPNKVTFQFMGLSRARLSWTDITQAGLVKGGYYYVEGKTLDRIYWSRAYKGFEHFEATLTDKCPSLRLPKYEINAK